VFVVKDDKAQHRAVEIGHRNPLEVEVLDGLKEGDTVITHPSDLLDEGVRFEED
jgi:HlyD family secretion protein